ncbi:MAG: hypothetical protein N4A33_07120 [Bacteriovoracaceae bacterium]|jgi:hypothetical protein|nr:hypothetical protein [Bacteriovoracaceae bacterium]
MFKIILILTSLTLSANTTKKLFKDGMKEFSQLNKNKSSHYLCSNKNQPSTILPYPTDIDSATQKIEEIEAICYTGNQRVKYQLLLRKKALIAFNDIRKEFDNDIKKFGLPSIQEYKFNQIGQIKDFNKSSPITQDPFMDEKIERKKLTQIKFYNGNSLESLKKKVLNNFPKNKNPFFKQKSNSDKCNFIKAAYFHSLWELSTLEPSFDFSKGNLSDLLLSPNPSFEEFKKYEKDKLKAAWALRYLLTIDQNQYPPNCNTKAGRSLKKEIQFRFEGINDPIMQKKPLGFAIGMCGRTMTGHCFDEKEKQERPEANNCMSQEHQQALFKDQILNKPEEQE